MNTENKLVQCHKILLITNKKSKYVRIVKKCQMLTIYIYIYIYDLIREQIIFIIFNLKQFFKYFIILKYILI